MSKNIRQRFQKIAQEIGERPSPDFQSRSDFEQLADILRGKKEDVRSFEGLGSGRSLDAKLLNDLASRQGLKGDALMAELQVRKQLIDQLLSEIPEDLVAQYFSEYQFGEKPLPWSIFSQILQMGLTASKKFAKLEDVLDFALEFYKRKRNFSALELIVREASDLQGELPLLDVFGDLKERLVGNPQPFSFLMLGPKNVKKLITLQRLQALTQARPDEDLEKLRIDLQVAKDAVEREKEITDRYHAIFSAMLSKEFLVSLDRTMKLLRSLFVGLVSVEEFVNLRRMLFQVRFGQEMKNVFFAPINEVNLAKSEKTSSIDERSKFVKLSQLQTQKPQTQTQAQTQTPAEKNNTKITLFNQAQINELTKFLNLLNNFIIKSSQIKGLETNLSSSLINLSKTISNNLSPDDLKSTPPAIINQTIFSLLDKLSELYNSINTQEKTQNQIATTNTPNTVRKSTFEKFIKTSAQSSGTPNIDLSAFNADISAALDKIAPFALATAVISKNPTAILGTGLAILLRNENKNRKSLSKVIGLPAPREEADINLVTNADAAFRSIFSNNKALYDQYVRLMTLYKEYEEQIKVSEQNLLEIVDINLATTTGVGESSDEKFYFENYDEIQEAHKEHALLLRRAFDHNVIFVNFLETEVKNNEEIIKQSYANFYGVVNQFILMMKRLLNSLRQKYTNFASIKDIAANIQRKKVFFSILKNQLPQIEKWLGAGVSISDVIRNPGGLLEQLKDILDQQAMAINIIFKEYNKVNDSIQGKPKPVILPGPKSKEIPAPKSIIPPAEIKPTIKPSVSDDFSGLTVSPPTISKQNPVMSNPNLGSYDDSEWDKYSLNLKNNFRFSNVITEQSSKSPYGLFAGKIDTPGTDLNTLFNQIIAAQDKPGLLIRTPGTLSEQEVVNLSIRLQNKQIDTFNHFASKLNDYTNQPELNKKSYVSTLTLYIDQNKALTESDKKYLIQVCDELYDNNTRKLPISPKKKILTMATERETGLAAPELSDEEIKRMETNKSFDDVEQSKERLRATADALGLSNLIFKPSENIIEPKAYKQSLFSQLVALKKEYEVIEGARMKLILNPTEAGGVSGLYNLIKANSDKKFIKLAEDKDIEADQKNIDYVGDYYDELYDESKDSPEFGEAIKHPGKWRKTRTVDIPEMK